MAGTCKRQSELLESGIGELSLLPLFLDLKGKRALVIGASQGAKWKVELLRSAGAEVEHQDAPLSVMSSLQDYSFIVADIADDGEATKFAKAVKAAVGGTRKVRGSAKAKVIGGKPRTRAVITDATRAEVKKLVSEGKSGAAIASELQISLPSVQNIKKALGLVKARK